MSHYYSGVVTWESYGRTRAQVRAELLRAARLARLDPTLHRPELVTRWVLPVSRALREPKAEAWPGLDDVVAVRCYGNYAWTEMAALAEAVARVSAISQAPWAGSLVTLLSRSEDAPRHGRPSIFHFADECGFTYQRNGA